MKRKLHKQRKSALTSEILSRPFSVEEMQEVSKTLKNRKAAGLTSLDVFESQIRCKMLGSAPGHSNFCLV
jgi:hypothetical protein